MTTIAIIGAGFSGMITAVNLFRSGSPDDELIVIERRREIGLGQAYSTDDDKHLLNIPAPGMSAFSQKPTAFADYLREHGDLAPADLAELNGFYAPRKVFAQFLRHIVDTQLLPGPQRPRLIRIEGEAIDITSANEIRLADGRVVHADRIVLAVGNLPPAPLKALAGLDRPEGVYIADPWAGGALDSIKADDNVLLVGTGLTTLDCVQTLGAGKHQGEIIAVSRHGFLPRRHEPAHIWPAFIDPSKRYSLRELVRRVRAQIAEAARRGDNWQGVLNSLRPFSQTLWSQFSPADQARFIRHIRPWWDVHRHRVAPAVADRVEALIASGQLRVVAGHLEALRRTAQGVDAVIRPRGTQHQLSFNVQKIVNCSGPNYDFATSTDILLKRLLERGRIVLDRHKLGVAVGDHFATVDREGNAAGDLFAMGPMLRGQYWEINAVAEIVAQAEALAPQLWELPQPRARTKGLLAQA